MTDLVTVAVFIDRGKSFKPVDLCLRSVQLVLDSPQKRMDGLSVRGRNRCVVSADCTLSSGIAFRKHQSGVNAFRVLVILP